MASSDSGRRLFLGNLSDSIDEYTLVKLFSKHGRIIAFDFLTHKAGPLKGKPRGFAFVEFETKQSASTALLELHNTPVRGRNMTVLPASQAPASAATAAAASAQRPRRRLPPVEPTQLSMRKASTSKRSTRDKIQDLEAKLNSMAHDQVEQASPAVAHVPSTSASTRLRHELPPRPAVSTSMS